MGRIVVDDQTILKTIPINTFSAVTGAITGFASCSIVQFKGSDIIVTVAHCTDEERIVGMNMSAYQGKPNILFFMPLPIKMMRMKGYTKFIAPLMRLLGRKFRSLSEMVTEDVEQYDLLYAKIPDNIQPLHNVVTSPLFNTPKIKIPIQFPCVPTKRSRYKFYGLSYVGFKDGFIHFDDVSTNDLRFVKTIPNYHVFRTAQLPDNIRGCSGAPILDRDGNIVSMVAMHHGNSIWGVDLNILNSVFEISYGDLK